MRGLNIVAVIALVVFQSCSSLKDTGVAEEVLWVSGVKTTCSAGAGKAECLNVYRGNDVANATWENFYAPIEGFAFEEGSLQKIKVKKEQLDPENVPADASSIKYTLIELIEKQADIRANLQGEWELTALNDASLAENEKKPTLSIDLKENKVSGTNSCNNFMGQIKNITSQSITLGAIATTRKMCLDMTTANAFDKALNEVKTYQIKGNNLVFYNAEGKKVLAFSKKNLAKADYRIHDIWVATRIEGGPINRMVKAPRLEVNLTTMKVMGNDGCNEYTGTIESISEQDIELGKMAVTQKMCRNMEVANRYNKALLKAKSYKVEEKTLTFYDSDKNEVVSFLKID